MAITIGNTSNGTPTTASSITWSHTNNGGFLVVTTASFDGSSGTDVISTVTYGGDSMTKAISKNESPHPFGGRAESSVWYLASPKSGANNVVATWTGSAAIGGGAISLNNVNLTDPIDVTDSSNGATGKPTTDVLTTTQNCIIIDALYNANPNAFDAGAAQTKIWQAAIPGGDSGQASYRLVTDIDTYTIDWDTAGQNGWTHAIATFKSVEGGSFIINLI